MGLEPTAPCMPCRCSTGLSYTPGGAVTLPAARDDPAGLSQAVCTVRPMPLTPSEIGARAELAVATALLRAGKRVYLPFFGSDGRVDLIVMDDAGVHRVQCKSSRLIDRAIAFNTCSNTRGVRQTYDGQVDFFGVYSPELDRVFLVPAAGLPTRRCFLRLGPSRNGQTKGIRPADDYAIGG